MSDNKASPKNPRNKLITWGLLAVIVLIGSGLSLYRLGAKSLWIDEITTVQIASQNYQQIYKELEVQHMAPPLYYLVLHEFLRFGSTEFLIRLLSVLFFVLSIIACFLIAQILFDKTTALAAALFFSLSPLQIMYAQEARMYSMCQLFVLLSFYFLIQAIKNKKMKFWIAYMVVTALSAYTHYFAVFYIFIQAILLIMITLEQWILLKKEKKALKIDLRPWFWFALSIIGIFLLYLPRISSSLARSQGEGLRESFSDAFNITLRFFGGGVQKSILPILFGIIFIWGLAACLLSRKKREGIVLGLWVLLPLPMIYFFLTKADSFFAERYVLFSNAPYLIVISFGLISLIRILLRRVKSSTHVQVIAYVCLALSVFVVHIVPIQVMYNLPKAPWREVAPFLREQIEDNEVLLVLPKWYIVMLNYYGFHPDKVITAESDDVEKVLRNKSDAWVLFSPMPHYNPHYAFLEQIESGKCIRILGGHGNLYLYYLRLNEDQPRNMNPILEAAINTLPYDLDVHVFLANEYLAKGDLRHTVFEYERALKLNPKNLLFMRRTISLYVSIRRFKPAIRMLKRAIDMQPSNADYYLWLADVLVQDRSFDDALNEYKKAAELSPLFYEKDWFYKRLGDVYRLKKDRGLAIEAYEKALSLNENNEAVRKLLAELK